MGNDVLHLNQVGKIFKAQSGPGPVKALENINLSISAGEFLALAGPSGSGKSTLINLIAGFIKPTAGRILHKGQVVSKPGPDRIVVFQDQAVFPWYTARDNIAYGLRRQKISRQEIQVKTEAALALVGLAEFADAYPASLSGGMRQRVALARALVLEPEILLLDEPFAALDSVTRNHLQDELLKLWQTYDWTVIFVTHNLAEAVYLADRVAVLHPPPVGLSQIVPINIKHPRTRRTAELDELTQDLEKALARPVPKGVKPEDVRPEP